MKRVGNILRDYWPDALFAAVVVLFYLPCLNYPVMEGWDDQLHILRNPHLEWTVDNLLYWLKTPVAGIYMPLTMWSYMMNYACGGLSPAGYHLVNILFHLAAVFFAYRCFRYFGVAKFAALFFLLIFALHPQRVESVVWLSERKDVMCAALYLFALDVWLRHRESRWGRGLVLGLFVASLLCKPMAVSLPLLFICVELQQCKDWRLPVKFFLRLLPFFLAAAVIGVVTTQVQVIATEHFPHPLRQVLVIIHNLVWYLRTTFLPFGLRTIYPLIVFTPGVVAGISFFYFGAAGLLFLLYRRFGKSFLCWTLLPPILAFLVMLAPVAGVFQLGSIDYADRYSYLPSLVIWLVVALVAVRLGSRFSRVLKPLGVAVMICYLLMLVGISWERMSSWKDYYTVLQDACSRRPANFIAVANLGIYEEDHGNFARLPELAETLLVDLPPGASVEHVASTRLLADYFHASLLERMNHRAEARVIYERISTVLARHTLFIDVFFVRTNSRLAHFAVMSGQKELAGTYLDRLSDAYSENESEHFFFRGLKNFYCGDYAAAAAAFRRAQAISPQDRKIEYNLAEAEKRQRQGSTGTH